MSGSRARTKAKKKGRPPKLNAKLQEKLCELVAEGAHLEHAANAIGITYRTIRRWRVWGEREDAEELYQNFAIAIAKAESICEAKYQKVVTDEAATNPDVALKYLAIRFPGRWAPQSKQQIDMTLSKKEFSDRLLGLKEELSPEAFRELLEAIASGPK